MATLLEQLAAVNDIASLKAYMFDPKTGEFNRALIPAWSKEDVQLLSNEFKSLAPGNGATTSPVTTPDAPVTTPNTPAPPVVSAELLPDLKAGFKLKGTEKKQQVVELLKGRTYEGSITLASADGGGVHLLGLLPAGNGFYNTGKLQKGINKVSFVAPATGPHRISVEANNANVDVSAATLTLKPA